MKLILLPGMDGGGELFKPFIDELGSSIDTLIIKYPVEGEQSYKRLSEYVVEHLPDSEFVLLGESFSGPIAYSIASMGHQKLKGVIFVATFLKNPRPFLTSLIIRLGLNRFLKLKSPDYFIKRWLLGFNADDWLITQFWHSVGSVPTNILIERLKSIADLRSPNRRLDIPCSYLRASNDILVPEDCLEQFKSLCQDLKEYSIVAPHFLMQAAPEECAKAINQELRRFSKGEKNLKY